MRVVNVYVVNGREVGTPEYELKLGWLDAFTTWLRNTDQAASPLLVVGDFNIAPDDRDVYDPDFWRGRNLCSEPERRRVRALLHWGLTDLGRVGNPGPGPGLCSRILVQAAFGGCCGLRTCGLAPAAGSSGHAGPPCLPFTGGASIAATRSRWAEQMTSRA